MSPGCPRNPCLRSSSRECGGDCKCLRSMISDSLTRPPLPFPHRSGFFKAQPQNSFRLVSPPLGIELRVKVRHINRPLQGKRDVFSPGNRGCKHMFFSEKSEPHSHSLLVEIVRLLISISFYNFLIEFYGKASPSYGLASLSTRLLPLP